MFDDPDSPSSPEAPRSKVTGKLEKSVKSPVLWAKASPGELVQWYQEIREHLPPTSLSKMNMEEELLLQFHTLSMLQTEVMSADMADIKEKVAVGNAVSTAIGRVMSLQIALYSSERFKAVELLLIRVLKDLPEDAAAKFLDGYEKILETYDGK